MALNLIVLLIALAAAPVASAHRLAPGSLPAAPVQTPPGDRIGATPRQSAPVAPPAVRPRVSAREAAAIAQAQSGGRVLSVQLIGEAYRVKLLKSGEVRVVKVPAY